MMNSQIFRCPSCRKSLTPAAGAATMTCPACSSSLLIPETFRLPVAPDTPGVLFADDFEDSNSGWENFDDGDGVTAGYAPDGYRIGLQQPEMFWHAVIDQVFDDVSVEVDLRRVRGPMQKSARGACMFGLLCRSAHDGGYAFLIDGFGGYGIYRYEFGDDSDQDADNLHIQQLAGSHEAIPFMDPGAMYRVRAVCQGKRLELYVNDRQLAEAEDETFTDGEVGLEVNSLDSDEGSVEVLFRRFVARKPA